MKWRGLSFWTISWASYWTWYVRVGLLLLLLDGRSLAQIIYYNIAYCRLSLFLGLMSFQFDSPISNLSQKVACRQVKLFFKKFRNYKLQIKFLLSVLTSFYLLTCGKIGSNMSKVSRYGAGIPVQSSDQERCRSTNYSMQMLMCTRSKNHIT
jgi:hypothetical protein